MQTDKPQSKPDKTVTAEVISEAIEKLSLQDWAKLNAFATNRARYMTQYGGAVDAGDLVLDAISAVFEERRIWDPKKVDFVGLLMGAMRSIASNHKAKSDAGYSIADSQVAQPTDDGDESETPVASEPDSRPNAETTMILAEREAETLRLVEELYDFFKDDKEARDVMDGWRLGWSGTEIIEALEIDRKGYETIVKRIRRQSAGRWSKVSTHVS